MPDRRTGYCIAGHDWPAISNDIPLDEIYRALDGITDEAVEAAMESLEAVEVPADGEVEFRTKMVDGRTVPLNPEECEPHTPAPEGYLQWHEWARKMSQTHTARQCHGCGLWAVWEPKEKPGA